MTKESKLFAARHGESIANAGKSFSNPRDIPLSDEGVVQSGRLANVIFAENIQPELIAVSLTTRSMQTSIPTTRLFPKVPVVVMDMHEFEYLNSLSGKATNYADRKVLRDAYWDRSDPDYRDPGEGSETFREFIARVDGVMDKLRDNRRTTLMFGHGYVMHAMEWRLEGNGDDLTHETMRAYLEYTKEHPIANTALHAIDLKRNAWTEIYKPLDVDTIMPASTPVAPRHHPSTGPRRTGRRLDP